MVDAHSVSRSWRILHFDVSVWWTFTDYLLHPQFTERYDNNRSSANGRFLPDLMSKT